MIDSLLRQAQDKLGAYEMDLITLNDVLTRDRIGDDTWEDKIR